MSTHPLPDNRTQAELLHDLREGPPQAQREALSRLSIVGEAEALDAVVEFLQTARDEIVRAVALNTLRILANKYVPVDRYGLAEVLIPFLSSNTWEQRLLAVRLLSTHPNEMASSALEDLVSEARDRISAEKNRFSPSRVIAERVLAEGVMAFANCGRLIALTTILEMLEDPYLRPLSTRALGVVGSETERFHLEDLTEDPDPRTRDAAQWALGLMDERISHLINPPDFIADPPPDRLNPVYWMHRQLEVEEASDLIRFLIVRIAVEHLLLDTLLSEGRVPETCMIVVRRYEGEAPPRYQHNDAEIVGAWRYQWHGPSISPATPPPAPVRTEDTLPEKPRFTGALITISYPVDFLFAGQGLVSFDCQFEAHFGRGWLYNVSELGGDWAFSRVRQTWAL
ncbi:MAG: hypothetical protein IT326_05750 [Anaerolineae bacterium]|nr:hypothetical protein [Anaerolineae bacterium]